MIKKSLVVLVVVIVAYCAYYLISPIFVEVHLDEAAPTEVSVEAGQVGTTPSKEKVDEDTMVIDEMKGKEKAEIVSLPLFASVLGTSGHPSSGEVRVVKTADGDVLRYENFKTINGPDLYVYLAKDLEASDFVNLGELKATEGNVNYSIPTGVDVSEYPYALVWCKQFGVLFSSADLSVTGI